MQPPPVLFSHCIYLHIEITCAVAAIAAREGRACYCCAGWGLLPRVNLRKEKKRKKTRLLCARLPARVLHGIALLYLNRCWLSVERVLSHFILFYFTNNLFNTLSPPPPPTLFSHFQFIYCSVRATAYVQAGKCHRFRWW